MPIKLIAPPHSPFHPDGSLNLQPVPLQARRFAATGIAGAFICGSTGESQSMSVGERKALAECWIPSAASHGLEVIVQVGSNCQRDAIELAEHAQQIGATAISSLAPCYFRPRTVADLVDFFEPIAKAAPELPFYFYDIPSMTGVSLSTVEFLKLAAHRYPNLAGVKYTSVDLVQFQECIAWQPERYEMWFGCDEALLAGYALGARGAVGSTYNFAAPLYHQMIRAFDEGDHETARRLQAVSVQLVRICESYGYMAAAKSVMSFHGIDCGPVRSPLPNLTNEQRHDLRIRLEQLGIFSLETTENQ